MTNTSAARLGGADPIGDDPVREAIPASTAEPRLSRGFKRPRRLYLTINRRQVICLSDGKFAREFVRAGLTGRTSPNKP